MIVKKTRRAVTAKTSDAKTPVAKPAAKTAKAAAPKPAARRVAVRKPVAKPVGRPTVKAAAQTTVDKTRKEKKAKVVRDSFTMPESDYAKIAELKKKCVAGGFSAKKSELLRAGLRALDALDAAALKRALGALENVKTGRPALSKTAKK